LVEGFWEPVREAVFLDIHSSAAEFRVCCGAGRR